MRCFTAIELSDENKSQLSKAIETLRSLSTEGNFTQMNNLHLTLVFLGEIGSSRLGALRERWMRLQFRPSRCRLAA